jgi:acetyltransferase-like isoleucine patch superfamily enzyme
MKNLIEKCVFIFFKRKIDFSCYSNYTLLIIIFSKLINLIRAFLLTSKFGLIGKSSKVSNVKFNGSFNIGTNVKLFSPKANLFTVGKGFSVGSFTVVEVTKNRVTNNSKIIIGDDTGFSEFSYINGAGGLIIGNNVICGQYLSIHPENHIINSEVLFRFSGVTHKGIKIGNNVWIGSKVTILDGSVIGDNCVIAAGAVVNGSFEKGVIIGGVPAKILKKI